jgi:hypothetical protein
VEIQNSILQEKVILILLTLLLMAAVAVEVFIIMGMDLQEMVQVEEVDIKGLLVEVEHMVMMEEMELQETVPAMTDAVLAAVVAAAELP